MALLCAIYLTIVSFCSHPYFSPIYFFFFVFSLPGKHENTGQCRQRNKTGFCFCSIYLVARRNQSCYFKILSFLVQYDAQTHFKGEPQSLLKMNKSLFRPLGAVQVVCWYTVLFSLQKGDHPEPKRRGVVGEATTRKITHHSYGNAMFWIYFANKSQPVSLAGLSVPH